MQSKLEKILVTAAISLLVLCLGAPLQARLGEGADVPAGAGTDSGKVASVNATAISRSQFDNALAYQQEVAAMRGVSITAQQLPALKYQVLESLINQQLLYQESVKLGIEIDDQDVIAAYETNRQKAGFQTDAEFEEALRGSNKTVASYQEEIREGLAIDRLIKEKFTDHTTVSDAEAAQYYTNNPAYFQQPARVRVSHIMIKTPSDADTAAKDAARGKTEKILERLKAGEDFAAVAGEVSEDANTRDRGGDLGYLSRGQTPQSFEDAAFALQKDDISDIVETGSGYHLLKLTDRKDASTVSYEDAKADIVDLLKTSKVNSSVDSYIKELKTRSTIVSYPVSQ